MRLIKKLKKDWKEATNNNCFMFCYLLATFEMFFIVVLAYMIAKRIFGIRLTKWF